SIIVTIIDATPPQIIAPADVTAETIGPTATVILGTPTVTDNVDSSPIVSNNAPSAFPIGTTTVIWTAEDFSGNTATAAQQVSITESSDDSFGVRKIYNTKVGGPGWIMNTDNVLNDPLFGTIPASSSTCTVKTCTLLYKNSDGISWHAGRMNVSANEGIRLVVKSPEDARWLNTEMTGYYKLTSSIYYPQEFVHVIRSGSPHAVTCEGYSYYAGLTYDGNIAKIQKALYHGGDGKGYTPTLYVRGITTPLEDRWIGLKTITYNLNGDSGVKIEIWIDDLNDNNWREVYEQIDTGWSSTGDPSVYGCLNLATGLPRSQDDIILWGGTEQQFRADNAEMDFKWLSIREIVPPA
ncbi:MAG: HYR domain-containing protein, partial [Nitrososphaerales archaeon]